MCFCKSLSINTLQYEKKSRIVWLLGKNGLLYTYNKLEKDEKQKVQSSTTSVASPFHKGASSQGQVQIQPQAQAPQGVGLKKNEKKLDF